MNQDYSTVPEQETQPAILETTIPHHLAGHRLDRVLAQLFPDYSRNRLRQWIEAGFVTLNGQSVTSKQANKAVHGDEKIIIHTQPSPDAQAYEPQNIALPIIYEDDALIVINKAAGLVVHPGHGHWKETLLNGLLYHYPQLQSVPRAGIVHRLDKDTTGLLVIAKTLHAQTCLIRQLQARSVKREYQALVWGTPHWPNQEYRIDTWMGRHPQHRTRMSVLPDGYGKQALTFFRIHRQNAHFSWLFCRLATGRTHQIRVHAAHLGYPILGDTVYGRRHDDFHAQFGQHALHAFRLTLEHPLSGKTLSWKVPLPTALQEFIDTQGWYEHSSHDFDWGFPDEGQEIDWDEDENLIDDEE